MVSKIKHVKILNTVSILKFFYQKAGCYQRLNFESENVNDIHHSIQLFLYKK